MLSLPLKNPLSRKFIYIFFGTLVLLLMIIYFVWSLLVKTVALNTVEVTVPAGAGITKIAQTLKQNQVIKSKTIFILAAVVSGRASALQAGTYYFTQANTWQIITQLANGYADTREATVTLIEGWDRFDIQNELRLHQLDADGFNKAVISSNFPDIDQSLLAGKPLHTSWEGYLFPDTYRFFTYSNGEEIVNKMLQNFSSHLTPEMQQAISTSSYNFYQILTLASIVEKEVNTDQDRKIVAGIFLKRLQDDYYLESDATVNFITGHHTTRPNAQDLARDSLYNTYQHRGLPPGPICNPSLSSLLAVLFPQSSDYYFFLNTPEGDIVYAATYQEHLQNKNQYYND